MEFEDEIVKELPEPLEIIELEVGIGEDVLVAGELGEEEMFCGKGTDCDSAVWGKADCEEIPG